MLVSIFCETWNHVRNLRHVLLCVVSNWIDGVRTDRTRISAGFLVVFDLVNFSVVVDMT